MSEARTAILDRIRRQLNKTPRDESLVRTRLAGFTPNLIPQSGRLEGQAKIDQFRKMAELAKARVTTIDKPVDVIPHLDTAFRERPLFLSDEVSALAPDLTQAGFRLSGKIPRRDGAVVMTSAFAGVAETGTLVMCCEKGHPHTLNILGEIHVVLLPICRIVSHYEAALDVLRAQRGPEFMPRTLLWITGPSRTGDIEQTMQLGAHGPKQLHIYLTNHDF